LASWIIVLSGLMIILLPSWLFLDSVVEGVKALKANFDAGTLTIPAPPEKVKAWPIFGDKVFAFWSSASLSIQKTFQQHQEQIVEIGTKVIKGLLGVGSGIVQMIVSLCIAGVLLVTPGAGESLRKFFRRVSHENGDEFADLAIQTVENVVKVI